MTEFNAIIPALGWSIVHSAWQITVIALFVKLFLVAFRKNSPTTKYNITLGGIFAMFTVFCITMAVMIIDGSSPPTAEGSGIAIRQFTADLPQDQTIATSGSVLNARIGSLMRRIDGAIFYIVAGWAAGFLFFLLRFTGGFMYIHRLRKKFSMLLNEEWQTKLHTVRTSLLIRKKVELLESPRVSVPLVIGYLKPAIILPLGLVTHIPFNQLEAILVHELAHIRRNDYIINLLVSGMEWLFFFHPLFWWMSGKLEIYREHCCDDITIGYCGDENSLQQALLDLSNYNHTPNHIAAALYKNDYQLLNRIKRMKTKNQKNHENRFNPFALLLTAAIFTVILAGTSFVPRPNDMLHGIAVPNEQDEPSRDIASYQLAEVPEPTPVKGIEPIIPDTTRVEKKGNTTKEFQDNGTISLELDSDGNLLSVIKDGKELSGEDREKYERLANKLKQLKEEEKTLEMNQEELKRIEKKLQESESRMREARQEYNRLMEDYRRVRSDAGWSSYENAWGLHHEQFMDAEKLEALIEKEREIASLYNQEFWDQQEQWKDVQQDLLDDHFSDNEQWMEFNEQFEDQFMQSQKQLEEVLKLAELKQAEWNDRMFDMADELKGLDDIKQIEMGTRIFEEVLRHELVKDGLLENPGDDLSFKLSSKRLIVNGEKQNSTLHEKYTGIYNKYSDTPLSGDMQVIISD